MRTNEQMRVDPLTPPWEPTREEEAPAGPAAETVRRPRPEERPAPIAMLGVLFDVISMRGTLGAIGGMIASRRPHYLATANVDFAVQALEDVELRHILADADLILCDGMPLVWASRLLGNRLPERVAGSDLVPALLAEAERRGWRVFFLGGTEESMARASANVRASHPGLELAGGYSPPFRPLLEMDHDEIVRRVHAARPDILLVAFGCPKQEKWINMHFRELGVPVSIGVGATLDFLAGSVRRAPRWIQSVGLEWAFRLLQEPRRLFRRYVYDLWVFSRAILRQWWALRPRHQPGPDAEEANIPSGAGPGCRVVRFGSALDAKAARALEATWPRLLGTGDHLLLDLSTVEIIDSTGIGLLMRLRKHWRDHGLTMVLVAPGRTVVRALGRMGLGEAVDSAPTLEAARRGLRARKWDEPVSLIPQAGRPGRVMAWAGEIHAGNAEEIWSLTKAHLATLAEERSEAVIRLAEVRFIDSTGVGVMVRAHNEGRRRGIRVTFTEPRPAVRNVLRILRLEDLLAR